MACYQSELASSLDTRCSEACSDSRCAANISALEHVLQATQHILSRRCSWASCSLSSVVVLSRSQLRLQSKS
jgi:hypothetical protein